MKKVLLTLVLIFSMCSSGYAEDWKTTEEKLYNMKGTVEDMIRILSAYNSGKFRLAERVEEDMTQGQKSRLLNRYILFREILLGQIRSLGL